MDPFRHPELIESFLNELDLPDLWAFCAAHRPIRSICQSSAYWRRRLQRDFPGVTTQGTTWKEIYRDYLRARKQAQVDKLKLPGDPVWNEQLLLMPQETLLSLAQFSPPLRQMINNPDFWKLKIVQNYGLDSLPLELMTANAYTLIRHYQSL